MAFGLRPVKKRGERYETGGFTVLNAADAYAVNIFNGDPVTLSSGNVVIATGAPQDDGSPTTIGVCVGCEYVDGNGVLTHAHWYQGNAANTDIKIYVSADPDQVFEIASDSAFAQAQVGVQYEFTAGAGDTSTGNSGYELDVGTGATATGGAIMLGVVEDGENEASSTPRVLIKWSAGTHSTLV